MKNCPNCGEQESPYNAKTKQLREERINQVRYNFNGERGICVGFVGNGSSYVIIKLDNNITHISRWTDFNKGVFHRKNTSRIGEKNYNNQGSQMTIIKYNNYHDVDVMFQTGYVANSVDYDSFKDGTIKDLLFPSVFGIGYFGVGDYTAYSECSGVKIHQVWSSMLNRCYNEKFHIIYPTYTDVIVDDKWHNYQVFAKWVTENVYYVPNEKLYLDKDILIKHNKIYSEDRCCFVPREINNLFTKHDSSRGQNVLGVYHKANNKYVASVARKDLGPYVKTFSSEIEAFNEYKKIKEEYIKYVANKYKKYIPQKLYDALVTYNIEISD